jgi:hypothetical protein
MIDKMKILRFSIVLLTITVLILNIINIHNSWEYYNDRITNHEKDINKNDYFQNK